MTVPLPRAPVSVASVVVDRLGHLAEVTLWGEAGARGTRGRRRSLRRRSSRAVRSRWRARPQPGPERDRSPDHEAHHGVHPALEPRRADRLPVAHLDDVVDDDRESEDRAATTTRNGIAALPAGANATSSIAGPKSAAATIDVGPMPKRRGDARRREGCGERARGTEGEDEPDRRRPRARARAPRTRGGSRTRRSRRSSTSPVQPACARRFGIAEDEAQALLELGPQARLLPVDAATVRGSSALRIRSRKRPEPRKLTRVDGGWRTAP